LYFLKQVFFQRPGRLELKSPPHTCRVKILSELFPGARFIIMVRSPYAVIPSTINLWKTLYQSQSLQRPSWAGLEDAVFETFNLFFERLEQTRPLVSGERFCQVRFEDLAADPLGQMRRVYRNLGLGDFDRLRPALEGYLAVHPNYQGRPWELSPALRRRITEECRPYLERHGYLHVPAVGGFEEENVVARRGEKVAQVTA
jgi:hypothetical protein